MAAAVTGDRIASTALQYVGRWQYVFGGTPTATVLTGDCSSFVSYVLGYRLRLTLPGGRWGAPGFPPNAHGPVVESYASWRGAVTVQSPQRGDLVCFVGEGAEGHIGIVLAVNQMVSALDPVDGCKVTPIVGYGPPGAPIIYRRVLAAAVGGALATVASPRRAGQGSGVGAAAGALLIVAGMVAVVLAAAALVGAGALAAAGYVLTRGGS